MITSGVIGQSWRASVTPGGALEPWDCSANLNWFVAADDRWHLPADEPSVRQNRVDGTAVVETRLRVPSGDVVQRIYSVADGAGLTIIEVENESTLPVAIAFDRRDVLTERPIVDVPLKGIDLPPGAFALPLGHKSLLRIGVVHGVQRGGALPHGIASAEQVTRGWLAVLEKASRVVLPCDPALVHRVTAERCELALGVIASCDDDPAAFAISVGELIRLGDAPSHWIVELAQAIEHIGPLAGWSEDQAIVAAGRVLAVAGETRALRDLRRITAGRSMSERPSVLPDGARAVPWLETLFATGATLFPGGLPEPWFGHPIEAHGIPTGENARVSLALRWHGARPAILWEQFTDSADGASMLTSPMAPEWSSDEQKGEALWPAPVGHRDL